MKYEKTHQLSKANVFVVPQFEVTLPTSFAPTVIVPCVGGYMVLGM